MNVRKLMCANRQQEALRERSADRPSSTASKSPLMSSKAVGLTLTIDKQVNGALYTIP